MRRVLALGVTTSSNDESRGQTGAKRCADCGASISGKRDQCLECRFMPSPWAAAVAVMGMLTLGVLLGSATSQVAQSAGLTSIVLEVPSPAPAEEPAEAPAAEAGAAPEPAPLLPATTSSLPVPALPAEEPLPAAAPEPTPPPELFEEEETLPPVKHVFIVMLGENGFEETFGPSSPAPYLSKELTAQGELLSNYYAVTHGDLANQIALLSGQGPTLETGANCPNYTDIVPGTVSAEGQVEGNGCVYPAGTKTLADQLVEKKLKWKAYVEDIGNGAAAGQPATCRHPAIGTPDPSQVPVPGDAYETWRNPFVYFHSILDGTECAERDIGLDRLATDLQTAKKTPALSYIVPNACHDGGEVPCEPGRTGGPLEAEETLKAIVPEILESDAYREGGLIAITSSQAPQAGEKADASACCAYPGYPNLPPAEAVEGATPGTKASGGGGRVGMLLISPYVKAGSVNETNYNHFTMLLTIEELFELEKLGYAQEAALLPFDSTVFNYSEEEESTAALSRAGSAARSAARARRRRP